MAGDLRITIGEGDGAAGHYYAPLRFNNTGTAACTLIGWPRLFYVAGDRLNQVGKAAKKIGDIGNAVILQPGDIAHADVDEVNVHNYANSACHIMSVRGLRIYPPHSKKSVFLQQSSRDACANKRLPGEQLQVKAIKPGPGSR